MQNPSTRFKPSRQPALLAACVVGLSVVSTFGWAQEAFEQEAFVQEPFEEEMRQQATIPYVQVKPDRIAPANGENADMFEGYTEIKVDRYSGGTEDPDTVYREMGDDYDSESMVVVASASYPENALPPPTVVPFTGYGDPDVSVVEAQTIRVGTLSAEDKVYQQIVALPDELDEPVQPAASTSDTSNAAATGQAKPKRSGRILVPSLAPGVGVITD